MASAAVARIVLISTMFSRTSTMCAAIFFASYAFADEVYTLTNGETVTPLERFQECDDCPEMVVMPMGSFMMGAIKGEARNPFDLYGPNATGRRRGPHEINIIPSEHPRHKVQIDIPFAIGRNEVTHREWMACVNDGGCSHKPEHKIEFEDHITLGPDHPVINISYFDIMEYVGWLNAQIGAEVYRLPTEAEWEYAARAGTTTRFAQGDDLTVDQANFSRGATEHVRGHEMPHLLSRHSTVGVDELDAANGWGVRHMSGNVREITMSCWSPLHLGLSSSSAYLADAQAKNDCGRVVWKGGAYNTAMDGLRLAMRYRPTKDRRRDHAGFRLVRQLSK